MADAAGSAGSKKLDWSAKVVVPIAVALISLAAVSISTCWKGGPAPFGEPPPPPGTAPETLLRGRVLDGRTLAPLASAGVEIELPEGVQSGYTDSRGVFQLKLPAARAGESFRIRVQAEGFEPYLQETTADLASGRLNDLRLVPLRRPPPSPPGGGGTGPEGAARGKGGAAGAAFPLTVTVVQGEGPREVPALGAVLSGRFLVQEGRQSVVLTLVGESVDVSRAFFGPGGSLPVEAPAGRFRMSLASWDPAAGKATVAFTKASG